MGMWSVCTSVLLYTMYTTLTLFHVGEDVHRIVFQVYLTHVRMYTHTLESPDHGEYVNDKIINRLGNVIDI